MAKFRLPDDNEEFFGIINQVDNEDKPKQKTSTKVAPPEQVAPEPLNDTVVQQSASPNTTVDGEVDPQKQKRKDYNSKRNYITSIVTPLERKYIELMRQKQGVSFSEYIQALIKKDMNEHPNEVQFAQMMLEQFESFLS